MASNVYALLIAVDKYRHPVPALSGCVQDSNEVQAYLEGTISADKLKMKTLRNEDATRANVIDAFLTHLAQADEEDSVFIHYSGHGSQENTSPVFAELEPDGKNETLVLYDSRQTIDGVYHRDLADKELRALIHLVAQKKPHIVGMFDCCHAGSNTRDTAKVTKRQAGDDKAKPRSLNEYIFMERSEFAETFQKSFEGDKMVGSELPTGSHIALQGALSSQTAKELVIDGKKRGAFTYAVLKYLKESQGDITYGELFSKVGPYVGKKVAEQNPQLDVVYSLKTMGSKPSEDMVFLKGTLKRADKSYLVSWDRKLGSWVVAAGQLNGVPATGKTRFTLYDSKADIKANPDDYLEIATSTDVHATTTAITFEGSTTIDKETTFKATILSLPITKTRVYFEAETDAQANGVKMLEDAFKLDDNAQRYLEVVTPNDEADYRILAYEHKGEEKIGFYRPTDKQPLIEPLPGINSRTTENALKKLSGISRWDRTQTMENPTTRIPQGTLQLQVEAHHFDPETDQFIEQVDLKPNSGGELVIPYQVYGAMPTAAGQNWGRTPVYKIKVKNNSSSDKYYLAVLMMGSDFSIQNILFGQNIIGPAQTIVMADGGTIAPNVPDSLVNRGIKQDTTYIKMIASTEPFKPTLLEQKGFEYPVAERSLGDGEGGDSFSMLLEGERTRSLMLFKPKKVTDWTTALISLTNIWDDDKSHAQEAAQSKVKITFPEGSDAKIKLASLGQTSRSVQGEIPGSSAMRSIPGVAPLELIEGQNTAPSMEVLELEGLDRSAVSKENPLILTFDEDLGEDDRLVIVQEDEGILLPWISTTNADGKAEIELDRLPEPSTMERGIGSSIKLVVHKLLGGKLGVSEFPLPRLGIPSIGTGEYPFEFNYDAEDVKNAVASAERIMLLIHGFTSSCNETYFVSNKDFPEQSILPFLKNEAGYDLVLIFDYETLNTHITDTAKMLKEQLAAAGLAAGHDKVLHIISHSMGGLVSRTFIELQGGNKVVSHLTMAGTPNGGSPWINLKEWALFGSTLLLNGIPGLGWGLTALGYLFGVVKAADKFVEHNSDAMKPGSVFLTSLKNAPDPGIPYTTIAGSLTMIPDDADTVVGRIMEKLGIGDPQFSSLKKFLFKDENDLFVGVNSVTTLSDDKKTDVTSEKAPCNHFGFFVPDGGMDQLKKLILAIKDKPAPADTATPPVDTQSDTPVETEVPTSTNTSGREEDTEFPSNTETEVPQKEADKPKGFWAWLKSLFS